MARITYHGEVIYEPDWKTQLLAYYRGEGAVVEEGVDVVFDSDAPAVDDQPAAPAAGDVADVEQPHPSPGPAGE